MFGVHWYELLFFLLIVSLLFYKKIPGVARSLGQTFTEFKKGFAEGNKLTEEEERDRRTRPPS